MKEIKKNSNKKNNKKNNSKKTNKNSNVDFKAKKILNSVNKTNNSTSVVVSGGQKIAVKKKLSFAEATSFSIGITRWVEDFKDGSFSLLLYDMALKYNTIMYYTNLNLKGLSSEEQWDILYFTDVYEKICKQINIPQYQTLIKLVNQHVSFAMEKELSENNAKLDEILNSDMKKEYEEAANNVLSTINKLKEGK